MPSPERPQSPQDPGPQSDSEQPFYYEVARFPTEPLAGLAYFAIQDLILSAKTDAELSVYRLQLQTLWNVAVLGTPPPEQLKTQIHGILEKGEPTTLPDEVLDHLKERRAQASKLGFWMERHRRPT